MMQFFYFNDVVRLPLKDTVQGEAPNSIMERLLTSGIIFLIKVNHKK